jgi:hypothetical protein
MSKELIAKISDIQSKLKAPKSQYNKFGQYAYRNQEDILEAVKPLLNEHKLVQTISDDVVLVGNRVYVKATVTVTDGEHFVTNAAFAREPQEQKGMNEAQITGSASSYARKYALNGMYAIDDTKDADATNDHGKSAPAEQKQAPKSDLKTLQNEQEKKADAPKQDTPKTGGRFAPKNKPAQQEAVKTEPVASSDDGWN